MPKALAPAQVMRQTPSLERLFIHWLPSLLLITLLLISLLLIPLRSLVVPPLRRPALHWYVLYATTAVDTFHLLLYVRPVFSVLMKLADVAVDFRPCLKGKRDQWNEAEGEPLPVHGLAYVTFGLNMRCLCRPSFVDLRREVATILTLRRDALVR